MKFSVAQRYTDYHAGSVTGITSLCKKTKTLVKMEFPQNYIVFLWTQSDASNTTNAFSLSFAELETRGGLPFGKLRVNSLSFFGSFV